MAIQMENNQLAEMTLYCKSAKQAEGLIKGIQDTNKVTELDKAVMPGGLTKITIRCNASDKPSIVSAVNDVLDTQIKQMSGLEKA